MKHWQFAIRIFLRQRRGFPGRDVEGSSEGLQEIHASRGVEIVTPQESKGIFFGRKTADCLAGGLPQMDRYFMKMPEDMFCEICSEKRGINPDTLKEVIILAVEIAREGREGRRIGTMFVVGDSKNVMKHSRSLILDPLQGHPDDLKRISDTDMRETVKELAQLDGAFVVDDDGTCISACRYLDSFSEGIDLPLGLGSRHMAAASITKLTNSVAVVVSESSVVRIIDNGEIVSEIIPELWMFKRYSALSKQGKKVEQEIILSTVEE
jgi:DNA integrity scanning protein DisA with diadenylate cyclase activity